MLELCRFRSKLHLFRGEYSWEYMVPLTVSFRQDSSWKLSWVHREKERKATEEQHLFELVY